MNHEYETVVSTEITSFVLAAAAAAIYFLVPGVWPLKARHGAQSGWNFIGPYWTNSWPNCEEHVLMIYRGKYWNCSWFQWRKTYDWDWPNAACSGCQWYSWALDNRFTRFHPFFFMRFPSSHIHPTWVIIATGIHAFFCEPCKIVPWICRRWNFISPWVNPRFGESSGFVFASFGYPMQIHLVKNIQNNNYFRWIIICWMALQEEFEQSKDKKTWVVDLGWVDPSGSFFVSTKMVFGQQCGDQPQEA